MNKKALTKIQAVVLLVVIIVAAASIAFVFYYNSESSNNNSKSSNNGALTIVDQDERTVQVPANVQRAVIIDSYWAEVACVLGDQNKIVGIGTYVPGSPFIPSAVQNLTIVGDQFGGINMETVVALKPDVVIMDIGFGSADQEVSTLENLGISVITLNPAIYRDEMGAIKIIGEALDSNNQANKLIDYMQSGLTNITLTTIQIPDSSMPSVLIGSYNPEYYGTSFSADSDSEWGTAVNLVGGNNTAYVYAPTQEYPMINAETVLGWNDSIVIITDYSSTSVASDVAAFEQQYPTLAAVENHQVYGVIVGGEQQGAYLDDGPRALLGLDELATIIQPTYFNNINITSAADQLFSQFYPYAIGS